MIDRLARAKGIVSPGFAAISDRARTISATTLEMLALTVRRDDLQVVATDNVTEHIFAQNPKEHWLPRDFPVIRPPFDLLWMETTRPSRVHSAERGDNASAPLPRAWGALVAVSPNADLPGWITKDRNEESRWRSFARGSFVDETRPNVLSAPAHEMLTFYPIEEAHDGTFLWPGLFFHAAYDREGQHLNREEIYTFPFETELMTAPYQDGLLQDYVGDLISATAPLIWPFMFALSLLNCRNVTMVEEAPPAKLSHAARKRHGRPLVSFRTVRILPSMTRRVAPLEALHGHRDLPLHMVRGHFKHYGPDAPLLGKHVGTYWWPAMTRGKAEFGEIDHEYEVVS